MSWQEVLNGIGKREIDATAITQEDLERLFSHLEQDEADRIQKEIYEAVTTIESSNELVATVVNILSGIAGIGLKIVAKIA